MNEVTLSIKERASLKFQAVLLGIPYIGTSLERFIFSELDELRMKRIENTLLEISNLLSKDNISHNIESEKFVNFFESTFSSLSKATNEEKRQSFRNLLFNVSKLEDEDTKWEEASLAHSLLEQIETPGLVLLSEIKKNYVKDSNLVLEFDEDSVTLLNEIPNFDSDWEWEELARFKYNPLVIERHAQKLSELKLIFFSAPEKISRRSSYQVVFTELGIFLTDWLSIDDSKI